MVLVPNLSLTFRSIINNSIPIRSIIDVWRGYGVSFFKIDVFRCQHLSHALKLTYLVTDVQFGFEFSNFDFEFYFLQSLIFIFKFLWFWILVAQVWSLVYNFDFSISIFQILIVKYEILIFSVRFSIWFWIMWFFSIWLFICILEFFF